jgi:Phage integrase, N-terminal SAM-like domain
MSIDAISPLRQRVIEDMNARKLCAGTQTGHIRSCKRFAAFLKRSPDTATLEDIRLFQLHLAETGVSICNRNRIMTPIADIAYHNKAVIYDLLFKASSEAVLTIAADPKHLGAHIGITAVLHRL